jgi:hypothetical protein
VEFGDFLAASAMRLALGLTGDMVAAASSSVVDVALSLALCNKMINNNNIIFHSVCWDDDVVVQI